MNRIYITDTSIHFPNLNIDFDFVPQSVSVRGFEISIFGLLVIVGMLLGLGVMIAISKARDENPNLCLETVFFSLVGGVLEQGFSMWASRFRVFPENLQKRLWISEQAECIFMEELPELFFWELCSAYPQDFFRQNGRYLLAWDSSLCR